MSKYKKLNINDFESFEKKYKDYRDGVLELRLTAWNEFHNVVKIFHNNKDYIWRGQREEDDQSKKDKLSSYFDREFPDIINREEELNRILNNLKRRLKDISKMNSPTDNQIWAIGQHYGLTTPLLDWTESPYIAAYFAFFKKSVNKDKIVIYALNKVLKLLKKGEDRFVEFDLYDNNFDLNQNHRLLNQKGKFTRSLNGEGIESILKKFWKETELKYKNEIILAKIIISNKFRDECLSSLESMNITHGVLFPDYAGAVDICKIDLGRNER